MGSLLEAAELVWSGMNPNGSAQTSIKKEEVVATAIREYAAGMWIYSKEEPLFEIPSQMLTTVELPVKDNYVDITGLDVLDSLPNDQWIQDISNCRYIKSSLNQERALRDDDSAGNAYTYYRVGRKILFPRGTHADKLEITYANTGVSVDPKIIEVNDYVMSKVTDKLYQIYGMKVAPDHNQNAKQ